jgi:diacylglycerol O-acyltransferase
MHTLKVVVLDPSESGIPYLFARVKEQLSEHLHLLPPLTKRVVPVPFGLHHPMWIEDPDFDLNNHVFHATVPGPGGKKEIEALIGKIASKPLQRDRPLWELWVLEGAQHGRIVALMKLHHTVADGMAAAQLLANVMSTKPGRIVVAVPEVPKEVVPTRGQLIRDALMDHGSQVRNLPSLIWRTARNLRRVVQLRRRQTIALPQPMLDTPKTRFNRALTPRRCTSAVELNLADLKVVKAALKITIGDLLLALVAESVRNYLLARGELPKKALMAEVPVGTDPPGALRLIGNRLSNLFTSLCTDVEDPIERAKRISYMTRLAKEVQETMGAEMFEDWSEYTPPVPYAWGIKRYAQSSLVEKLPPAINVIVSNVRGPAHRLYWGQAPMHSLYSVGPIVHGVGLNVTAWSYLDTLYVSAIACPDSVPDLAEITDGIATALQLMRERLDREQTESDE